MWRLSHRLFAFVAALGYRIGRRLTPAGMLVVSAGVVAGALGVDTTLSVAYQGFALMTALVVVAAAGVPLVRTRVTVERELPRVATAGASFTYRVRVRNVGSRVIDGLAVIEDLPDPRPSLQRFRTAARFPTYRAWKRLVHASRRARAHEGRLPALPPGGSAEAQLRVEALRRGVLHTRGLTVARSEPLGLIRALATIELRANVIVLPRRYRLPPLALPGSRRYQQGGVALATSVGDSEEFVGLRDYRPGDPLQRIHWKSFARAARPVVREYQDEFFERHALVLDTFARPGLEARFEDAVSIAASFACTIDTRECLLDLMFLGAREYRYTAGRGQLAAGSLLEVLASVAPCRDRPFGTLTAAVLARRHALAGCVGVLLDWDEARRDFAQTVRAHGIDLRAIVVTDAPVLAPPPWLIVARPGRIEQDLAACGAWA